MDGYQGVGTDYSFVERELQRGGYFTDEGTGTRLSDVVQALFATLDGGNLDLRDRKAVAQLFSTLVEKDGALGQTVGTRSTWKQFYLGTFQYGTTVRVKTDAYDTPAGKRHNGLTGTFVSAYAGRAYVQYHGRKDGSGHEHSPYKLEALWKAED